MYSITCKPSAASAVAICSLNQAGFVGMQHVMQRFADQALPSW
jgi:hypothetical protein